MDNRFFARLSDANEVPPKNTDAFGTAEFVASECGTKIQFRLIVRNISKLTEAHIHVGKVGQNGPVIVYLFGKSKHGISVKNGIITGTIMKDDIVGPLKGRSIKSLVRLMESGNTYVNAHTEQNPEGEIRGQMIPFRKK
ncbi:CHRD domain-containing protein [Fictibacillus sp. Mic-4]|uniref:CHRD domain-containing protein n=1 Tax=Fictibacillus sp. Mic-4 TaxID=3132826 RepID=UPI003CF123E1